MGTGLIGGGTASRSPLALLLAVAGLVVAVLACYLPTPGDYWIRYDNVEMIQRAPRTLALALEGRARIEALATLVATPHHNLYQPLASFSWALDYALFGWDRSGFHAHSIALHLAVVLALFFLALRLCHSTLAAFLATLLCAVHPVMVQTVCWTIARTSSLTAFWILIGSHLHLSHAKRPTKHHLLAFSAVAFTLSTLAKPLPSIILVPLAIDLWIGRPLSRRVWLEKLPLTLAVTIVTLANLLLSASLSGPGRISRPWLDVLGKMPEGIALSLANVAWPRDLALHYGYELAGSLIGWRWLAVAAAGGAALWVGAALWRRGERGVLLSIGAFLALLAQQLAAVRYRDVLTADRYVYIPLLFLALGAASLLARVLRDATRGQGATPYDFSGSTRLGAIALALVAAAGLGVQARAESRRWADEETLWQRVVSQTPAPIPYLALCKLHGQKGRTAEAVEACVLAEKLAMQDPYASQDPAYAFYTAARARSAGEEWAASTETDAQQRAAEYFDLATTTALAAIARWPARIDVRYELGRTQLATGDARSAIETFDALLAIEADEPTISYLGVALFEAGDYERALETLEANIRGGTVEPIRYSTLAKLYTAKGDHYLAAWSHMGWLSVFPEDEVAHDAFQKSAKLAAEGRPGEEVDAMMRLYRRTHVVEDAN